MNYSRFDTKQNNMDLDFYQTYYEHKKFNKNQFRSIRMLQIGSKQNFQKCNRVWKTA